MSLSDPRVEGSLSYALRSKRDVKLRAFLERNGRRILDVGGSSIYWRRVGLDWLTSHGFTVTLMNLSATELGEGPFESFVGDATAIDLPDNSFDVVHSNSVIEHVGDDDRRRAFADNVRRLAPAYYVQTPNYWFPFDPHFWKFPGFQFLPISARTELLMRFPIAHSGRLQPRAKAQTAVMGTRLLSARDMRALFPDGALQFERFAGMGKSIIVTRERA